MDESDAQYFINHLNRTTTYFDPRREEEPVPEPRHVTLSRDPNQGFGFVAGSEKPVIVRFVSEGGPSVGSLMPGDQLLVINGCDVKCLSRDLVIDMVHSSKDEINMVVCQPPPRDNVARKSAILSATKKLRLKSSPSCGVRVRFSSGVIINGHSSLSPFSVDELHTPFMPNVLKVFLENGQTKSFKYSSSTTVQEVLKSLASKLGISKVEHFGIALQQMSDGRRNRLELLDGDSTVVKIASQPGAHNLRCILRFVFVPNDGYELFKDDPVAFEYLYVQCCADVLHERFAPELKHDVALLLSSLHIHQHITSGQAQCKPTVKNIEREYGLQRFVPSSLLASMKPKELRKMLAHFLKSHQVMGGERRQAAALQYKLNYLKIISELPSYGAKCYSAAIDDESKPDSVLLVSPRFGVSRISALDNDMPERVCDIDQLASVEMTGDSAGLNCSDRVSVLLMYGASQSISVSLDTHSASELVLVLAGYFRLLTGKCLPVKREESPTDDDSAPAYHCSHRVTVDTWSYSQGSADSSQDCRTVDLSLPPPDFRQTAALSRDDRQSSVNKHLTRDNNMNNTGKIHLCPSAESSISGPESTISTTINQTYNQQVLDSRRFSQVLADQEQSVNQVSAITKTVSDIEGADVNDLTHSDGDNDSLRSVVSQSLNGETVTESRLQNDGLLRLAQISKDRLDGVDLRRQSAIVMVDEPRLTGPGSVEVYQRLKGSDSGEVCQRLNGSSSGEVCSHLRSSGSDEVGRLLPRDGSSFGLHSHSAPAESDDRWNPAMTATNQVIPADSDLIDLTRISPPATPDQELSFDVASSADVSYRPLKTSSPPTPFSDGQHWAGDDGESIGQLSTSVTLPSANGFISEVMCISPAGDSATSSGFDSQPAGSDIDSMIANLTLPPPPKIQETSVTLREDNPVVELTRDDIASFIIPPPPGSSEQHIHQGVEQAPCSLDPMAGSDEIHVRVTRCARQRVCSKIASLQQTLLQSSHQNNQNQRTAVYAADQQLESALEQNQVAFGLLTRSIPSNLNTYHNVAGSESCGSHQSPDVHHSLHDEQTSSNSQPSCNSQPLSNPLFVSNARLPHNPHYQLSNSPQTPCLTDAVPPLPPKKLVSSPARNVPPLPPKVSSPHTDVGPLSPRQRTGRVDESCRLENKQQQTSLYFPSMPPSVNPAVTETSTDALRRLQFFCQRLGTQQSGSGDLVDMEQLSAVCRQLVTASKLLVQAAADGGDTQQQLVACVELMEAAVDLSSGSQSDQLTHYLRETCTDLLTTAQHATFQRLDVVKLTDSATRLASALTVLMRAIKSVSGD